MIKHIIIWDLKQELSSEEKIEAAAKIKHDLEMLVDKIDGIKELKVITELLSSSNGSIMLDSTFDDENALDEYAVHPEHLKVKEYISTVVCSRKCADYII